MTQDQKILYSIKLHMPEILELSHKCENYGEDGVYRFYHQSYKVYRLQDITERCVKLFNKIGAYAGIVELNSWYLQIVKEGTSTEFSFNDNKNWLASTRSIVEAYNHSRYFIEMMCKYGNSIEEPPQIMPSGWAVILCLYNSR